MVPKWAIIPVARTLIVQAFTDPWHDKRILIDEDTRRVRAVRIDHDEKVRTPSTESKR
jgi:hypothetical protein